MSGYRFDRVTKSFGGEVVLDKLTLTGQAGSFLCVIGKSGVGKSTLLRLLGGFDQAEAGHVYVDGDRVKGPKKNRPMVFQSYEQLFPWLPVWENVAFPLRVEGVEKHARKARALEALEAVGLKGHENKYPHQLSGGMKQRAALARAWIAQPKLLLMDEPFGGLDMMTRQALQGLLADLWRDRKWTLVFITHDMREAALLSTDLLILKGGGRWEVMKNPLPWPRDSLAPAFNQWLGAIRL